MKVPVLILNSMFLLLFISTVIGEWGKGPAIIAGIAIANLLMNSIFIFIKVKNDFGQESPEP
jgi:urea transporter